MFGYLKRRFSSGDLQDEAADQREQEGLPSFLNPFNTAPPAAPQSQQQRQTQPHQSNPVHRMQQRPTSTEPSLANTGATPRPKTAYPSAPTSPTRSSSGFSAAPMVESITGQITNTISRGFFAAAAATVDRPTAGKGKFKTLLIIDEPHIDWSKYFRGRKIFGDWDLRVEQAEFSEISLVSFSEHGCTVDVHIDKSGTKTMKSFKPDFLVVRQSTSDANENWKNFLMGFLYGGVPSLNSLHALFNMHDRPWMYAHLELVRNRLGKENFPLIEQAFYPSYKEMVVPTKFPMVIKIGNCRNGKGKIKVENHFDFQDIASVVAVANTFATSEPFIDAKCDVVIQKIGNNFKVFLRKSLSGSWKTNTGSAILEQVPMTEKFKLWITEVAKLFGGLDMCSLKAVQSKTDDFHIYEVKGSNMNLLGETQEDDRKLIAELIWSKMQIFCRPNIPKAESLHVMNRQNESSPVPQSMPSASSSSMSIAPSQMGARMNSSQLSGMGGSHDFTSATSGSPSFMQQHQQHQQQNQQQNQQHQQQPSLGNTAAGRAQNFIDNKSLSMSSGIGYNPGMPNSSGAPPASNAMGGPGSAISATDSSRPPLESHQNMQGMPGTMASATAQMNMRPGMGPPQKPGSQPIRPNIPPRQTSLKSNASVDDGDDTMKNLRKTFAGIFGDM